jgi:CRISPR-associated protein Csb1
VRLPLIQLDFSSNFPDIGIITSLDAPHRIADAIFRDSKLNDKNFRESVVGKAFVTPICVMLRAYFSIVPTRSSSAYGFH